MKLQHSLELTSGLLKPCVLTIGMFDGMHKGHQAVIKRMKEIARSDAKQLAAITFENHPISVLRPGQSTPWLCTFDHRIRLLEEAGIDILFVLQFTESFSRLSPEEFLKQIYAVVPFSHVVLGYDAAFGRDRSGDRESVSEILNTMNAKVEYLDSFDVAGEPVSSSRIRGLIQTGDFALTEQLLGRPFSVYGPVVKGRTHGKSIGFPTANLDVAGLCMPPLGVYAVEVKYRDKIIKGVANLGVAPTLRDDNRVLLEAYLFDWTADLYGEFIEVIFRQHLRSERKFNSVEELCAQIERDVADAKRILS